VKFSRERTFYLAGRILDELLSAEGVIPLKERDDVRAEISRVLAEETRLEESIDQEVRRVLSSYSRPLVAGSPEWEILYQKTREEIYRRRFRLT
jgi:hypothetical protein